MLPCSKPGELYSIDVEAVNSGIPYADSFYITTHYCLNKVGENETSFSVFSNVKYKKSVWGLVKSISNFFIIVISFSIFYFLNSLYRFY